jgi:hypothetical protein
MCSYLEKRWCAIRQDGSVNTCCMDAESKHPLGTVYQEPGSLRVGATPLCADCHLVAPLEVRAEGHWPHELIVHMNERRAQKQVATA